MTDSPASQQTKSMDDIMALCKRRGFIFQASEIYGGINGFWDYGPLGSQLKKNLRDAWWDDVVMTGCCGKRGPDGNPVRIVPVDTCIIQNPKVWEASGHVAGFSDPMVDCRACKSRFRADKIFDIGVVMFNPDEFESFIESFKEMDRIKREVPGATAPLNLPPALDLTYSVEGDGIESVTADWRTHLGANAKKQRRSDIASLTNDDDAHILYSSGGALVTANASEVEYRAIIVIKPLQATSDCPNCREKGSLTEPRAFNLMFPTVIGATGDWEENKAYLRPETAQGIFVNYKNVLDSTRVKVPFGIAQSGKAFRNEVTPRNFTFRSREFEQMEIEFFCRPDSAREWYTFWRDWRMQWWKDLGLAGANLILREHEKDELAHYAKEGAGTSDVEYRFPFTAPGFGELEGIAHRTDFDLRQHQQFSGAKLEYFDQERNERYLPHVIEPSAGLDRGVLALICEAFTPDPTRPSGVYMKFHPRISPIKAAVFPLVNKDGMPEVGEKLHAELARKFARDGLIELDAKQSIGKRYARMDEAGCPFCFTIDGETLTDQTVTVRHRDTQAQERIALDAVPSFLGERLGG